MPSSERTEAGLNEILEGRGLMCQRQTAPRRAIADFGKVRETAEIDRLFGGMGQEMDGKRCSFVQLFGNNWRKSEGIPGAVDMFNSWKSLVKSHIVQVDAFAFAGRNDWYNGQTSRADEGCRRAPWSGCSAFMIRCLQILKMVEYR